jgi:hypothetical protein
MLSHPAYSTFLLDPLIDNPMSGFISVYARLSSASRFQDIPSRSFFPRSYEVQFLKTIRFVGWRCPSRRSLPEGISASTLVSDSSAQCTVGPVCERRALGCSVVVHVSLGKPLPFLRLYFPAETHIQRMHVKCTDCISYDRPGLCRFWIC